MSTAKASVKRDIEQNQIPLSDDCSQCPECDQSLETVSDYNRHVLLHYPDRDAVTSATAGNTQVTGAHFAPYLRAAASPSALLFDGSKTPIHLPEFSAQGDWVDWVDSRYNRVPQLSITHGACKAATEPLVDSAFWFDQGAQAPYYPMTDLEFLEYPICYSPASSTPGLSSGLYSPEISPPLAPLANSIVSLGFQAGQVQSAQLLPSEESSTSFPGGFKSDVTNLAIYQPPSGDEEPAANSLVQWQAKGYGNFDNSHRTFNCDSDNHISDLSQDDLAVIFSLISLS